VLSAGASYLRQPYYSQDTQWECPAEGSSA
jgi:hypothetical protein